MATLTSAGAALAAPNVIAFPKPVMRGRKRKVNDVFAACGDLSLCMLDRDGRRTPANVVRLAEVTAPDVDPEQVNRMFAATIYAALAPETKATVRDMLKPIKYGQTRGCTPGDAEIAARLLHAMTPTLYFIRESDGKRVDVQGHEL